MSFSYRARDKTCYLSGEGLHYDADWVYYERDVASIPKDWKRGSSKELAAKKAFKGQAFEDSPEDKKEAAKDALTAADSAQARAVAKVETLKAKISALKGEMKTASTDTDKKVVSESLQAAEKQ